MTSKKTRGERVFLKIFGVRILIRWWGGLKSALRLALFIPLEIREQHRAEACEGCEGEEQEPAEEGDGASRAEEQEREEGSFPGGGFGEETLAEDRAEGGESQAEEGEDGDGDRRGGDEQDAADECSPRAFGEGEEQQHDGAEEEEVDQPDPEGAPEGAAQVFGSLVHTGGEERAEDKQVAGEEEGEEQEDGDGAEEVGHGKILVW